MNNTKRTFRWFYLFLVIGTLLASAYPLYMGYRVISDMVKDGTVLAENYPKYIIPYTPISIALILGVLLMPLIIKLTKRFALLVVSALSIIIFFTAEIMFERMVFVTTQYQSIQSTLESWQMFMCAYAPSSYLTRTWTEVDMLMGEYSPAFKIHFYIISVVLILSLLNCFYGFAKMIKENNKNRFL